MGKPEIEQFLTALAVKRNVAASTHNQALAALLFLYKDVLERDPGWLDDVVRAKRPERLPTVLTRQEVDARLAALDGVSWIMAMVLYGSGLRLLECLRLRVKDIDFTKSEILVREGKENKACPERSRRDRVTMLASGVSVPQRAIREARRRAGIAKPVGPHALRHCFATHLLRLAGHPEQQSVSMGIRTVQELLGHRDVVAVRPE